MLLEGLVVDHRLRREDDTTLRPDANGVARKSVPLEHLAATCEQARFGCVEMLVRARRQHLEQARSRGGHRERIAVERADLVDSALLDDLERRLGTADRAARQTAAERLREGDEVGRDPEALRRSARRDAEPRLHLVEDQEDAVHPSQLPNRLEISGLG